jgi:hypothetical protein
LVIPITDSSITRVQYRSMSSFKSPHQR